MFHVLYLYVLYNAITENCHRSTRRGPIIRYIGIHMYIMCMYVQYTVRSYIRMYI